MKDMLATIGWILGFALLMLVVQFFFDPAAAQQNVVAIINAVANIYHSAIDAFSR